MNRNRYLKTWIWPIVVVAMVGLAGAVYTASRPSDSPSAKKPATEVAGTPGKEAAQIEGHKREAGESQEPGAEGESGHEDEVTLTAQAIQQNSIRLEAARKLPLRDVFSAPARVSYNAEQMAHVGTPVTGRLAEVRAKLGDVVKTGDVLFIVESTELGECQSDLLQKRTQVQVAQSGFEVSKTASERAKRLLEGKGISLSEQQKREGEFRAAEGALRSAEAALTAADNRLHLLGFAQEDTERLLKTGEIDPRYRVRAPLSGTVIEREATLGEIVGPEREALLVLADMKTLWVLADVPENILSRIVIGSSATVSVPAIKAQKFVGRISHIAPALDKATRTGQVRIEVADGHTPLKPGMFAQVQLKLNDESGGEPGHALAVPEAAIQTVEGGPAVFVPVEGEANTFIKQAVQVGPTVQGMVPVLSGLEEGKYVVVAGTFILKAELAKGEMEGKTCTGH